ncbi:MAG TPA: hypothetical protein VNT23_06100 [Gaiellaceae bacterium]|nr:hypothetical protein [Gaiellaceae bacterium]
MRRCDPELLRAIVEGARRAEPPGGMSTRIVAIDGQGGAGKSTLAEQVARELDAPVLHTDDFASWEEPLDWWPRLIDEALRPLARGERARFRRSSWGPGHDPGWAELEPAPFVVLEGVTASREAFRPWLAYTVWVETPFELRLARGVERDGEAMRGQWEEWARQEDAYVAAERPHERADLVVRGDRDLWR